MLVYRGQQFLILRGKSDLSVTSFTTGPSEISGFWAVRWFSGLFCVVGGWEVLALANIDRCFYR